MTTGPLELLIQHNRRLTGGFFDYSITFERRDKGSGMPQIVTMTTEYRVKLKIAPVTAAGNPAPLDGAAVFTVESGAAVLEQIDDTSAWAFSDAPGDSVIMISADADVGAGVETIADTVTLKIEGAKAASLGLTYEQPELRPAPPTP